MSHLDEGRLLELRDDAGSGDVDARRHLDGCHSCREALEELRGRETAIGVVLESLDARVDLEAARAAVRRQVTEHSAAAAGAASLAPAPSRGALRGLSRAAGILLVAAGGAAAALPGSPVRSWISAVVSSRGADPAMLAEPEAATEAATEAETAGVRLGATTGALRIVLRSLAPGEDLRVQWVPGAEAAVFAPLGSRFATGRGWVEADLAPGAVRVELPAGSQPVTLEVDGIAYLRRDVAGLELPGPVASRAGGEVVFRRPPP